MERAVFFAVFAYTVFSWAGDVNSQEIWVGKDGSIRNVGVKAMFKERNEAYLATRKELYRSIDAGVKWEPVFSLPPGENEINCLAGSAKDIFAGTKRGLFRSQDRGKNWQNVFRTIIPDRSEVLCIAESKYNPKKIVIGTLRGVFTSEDSGAGWKDISGSLKNRRVSCVFLNKDSVYAVSDDGLYVNSEGHDGWQRIYVKSAAEKTEYEESPDTEEPDYSGAGVRCVALKDRRIYIGVDRKILYSDDAGKTWNGLPVPGLTGVVNFILASSGSEKLYCATSKGVFEFSAKQPRWLELYKGIDKSFAANSIVFDDDNKEDSLWAVTDNGLYKLENERFETDRYVDIERNIKEISILFGREPAFKELQEAAMKFAEVDPDKIKRWRNQARLKALVPKVSLSMDNRVATNSEIYTSATRDYVALGPDDISKGVGVSVSWELANLIWSDDQTNIDVRSRLTTQLRNDILDDLRRAYFERKRLQFDIAQNPPKDVKGRFEKEMRLQELTQIIDDLTGNYLSKRIEEKRNVKAIDS